LFLKIVPPGTILKTKNLQGPKTIFFLQGLKPKRGIFAGTKTILDHPPVLPHGSYRLETKHANVLKLNMLAVQNKLFIKKIH